MSKYEPIKSERELIDMIGRLIEQWPVRDGYRLFLDRDFLCLTLYRKLSPVKKLILAEWSLDSVAPCVSGRPAARNTLSVDQGKPDTQNRENTH